MTLADRLEKLCDWVASEHKVAVMKSTSSMGPVAVAHHAYAQAMLKVQARLEDLIAETKQGTEND